MPPEVITVRGRTVTVYQEGYPKTKYPTGSGGSVSVTSPEQEKSLGPGWQDHPPFVAEPEPEPRKRRKVEVEAT